MRAVVSPLVWLVLSGCLDPGPVDTGVDSDTDEVPFVDDTGGGFAGGEAPAGYGPAQLRIAALDIWGQPLLSADSTLSLTHDGAPVALAGWPVAVAEIEEAGTYEVVLSSDLHEPLVATLTFDGSSEAEGLALVTDGPAAGQGLVLTHGEVRGEDGKVAIHRLFMGLRHQFFSAQGRPARRGNRVELFRSGETAWASVAEELSTATDQVHWATWWWTSDFELVRGSGHVTSSRAERDANTIMARLDARPATKRILVADILFDITLDDPLEERGEAGGDDFEVMRHANETSGQFMFEAADFSFADRVRGGFPSLVDADFSGDDPVASRLPTRWVDLNDWPIDFEFEHASYHQKFGTIDSRVAFVGGMNFQGVDWDTTDHAVFDARRMPIDASTSERLEVVDKEELPEFGPRRDYMTRIEGPLVQDVDEVFHLRWQDRLDAGEEYSEHNTPFTVLRGQPALSGGVQAQITTTMPEPFWEHSIAESWFNAVAQAEDYLFIEDQYFRMPMVVDALIERMDAVPDLEVVVLVRPVSEWTDTGCEWTYRTLNQLDSAHPGRFHAYTLRSFDTQEVFAIWDETEERFTDMDIHSKLLIVDDVFLSVGSANKNNRGLIYEAEMNLAVVDRDWVAEQRRRVVQGMLPAWIDVADDALGADGWIAQLDDMAVWNQSVLEAWDDESGDLDLDGDPLPVSYVPEGFVYPLFWGHPDDCFIEGVGPDGA